MFKRLYPFYVLASIVAISSLISCSSKSSETKDSKLKIQDAASAASMSKAKEAAGLPVSGLPVQVCTDILPPGNYDKGAADKNTLWKPGSVLKVKFLGGEDYYWAKVRAYAVEWEKYANIKFQFVNSGPAHIRVSMWDGKGSWSFPGNSSTKYSKDPQTGRTLEWNDGPSMNFGWFTRDLSEEGFRQVIYHEFGHSLGLIHEHQSPAGGISWNKPVVYQHYLTNDGWSKEEVDHNIFEKYDATFTQFSAYDKASIMHYPIPAQHVTNPAHVVAWNTTLSAMDKKFITAIYPRSVAKPVKEHDRGEPPHDVHAH